MSPRVILEPNRPNEEIIPNTVGWERTREIGKMRRVLIDVERSQAQQVTLEKKETLVELEGVDTLRLVDVETGGPTWTLVCYSLEWNANVEVPTPGGDLREGDDQTLITNLASNTQFWDVGNIGSFTSGLSFVFSHAQPHEMLRRIERNVPGEIRFRDRGTVDYVDRLGSDKSGSVELSASAGTIEDAITITEGGRQLDGTHIRVLGAHEGEAQYFVNLVPQDDPATYENDVRYSTPRWTSSTDTDWDRWENKDVADQSTLESEAEALADEISESLVEAKTKTSTTDLSLGDTVQVVKPDADLDRSMRVHRVTTRAGGRNNSEGSAAVIDELLLSTRTTARNDSGKDLRSIRQFNTGFQGASVSVQGGGGRQPVAPGVNAEIPFDYPDIAFENDLQLQVRGLPYRAYSSGAASGGTTLTQNDTDPSSAAASGINGGGYTSSSSWDVVDSFSTPDTPGAYLVVQVATRYNILESDNQVEMQWRVSAPDGNYPSDEGTYQFVMQSSDQEGDGTMSATIFIPGEAGFRTYFIQAKDNSGGGHSFNYVYNWMMVSPHAHTIDPHTHDPDPGVIEFGNETPSNVDVLVNGTEVATDIGSGTFETEVDIGGTMDTDAWNMVELTSDSLGHIQGAISLDGYKQIGKK